MSYLENIRPARALELLGLRQEPHPMTELVLPALALFGLGVGIGAGVALLLAPQTGRELRDDLSARAGKLQSDIRKALPTANGVERRGWSGARSYDE
jgi:hypothetical protein